MSTRADEVYETGVLHGWESANYGEAYGRDEAPVREAARRSREHGHDAEDRTCYRDGFCAGFERFQRGEYPDGQPMDDGWRCPVCGDDDGHCPERGGR